MSNIHSLWDFLSTEESKLLDIISKSTLSDNQKEMLEVATIPSIRGAVEKIIKWYLWDESDLRVLGDLKTIPKVLSDIEQEDGWNNLGSMKKRMVVRGLKWKEEMEEGYKDIIRNQIRSRHTLDVWMNLSQKEKGKEGPFIIWGKSYALTALATLFKTGGLPISSDADMLKILEQIYTLEEFEVYVQWVKDQVRSRHTLDVWMNLSNTEKGEEKLFDIWGKPYGLTALATFFKTGGQPAGIEADMRKLLEQIYAPEEFEAYYQWVKDQIRSRHPLDVWMNLSSKEKKGEDPFLIRGNPHNLTALATFFKIGGQPAGIEADMRKLLEQIYAPEEFEAYYQWVKDQIRSRHTLEAWMSLTKTQKVKERPFIIWGKPHKLQSLATFFKTGGRPENSSADFKILMIKIYWEDEVEKSVHLQRGWVWLKKSSPQIMNNNISYSVFQALNIKKSSKQPLLLNTFLSTEESQVLELISKSSLSESQKEMLEVATIPSIRGAVEKILKWYLWDESDLRFLGDPKTLSKVISDIEQEDGWNTFGSMKRHMVARLINWKEELEEGYKEVVREKVWSRHTLDVWMNLSAKEKREEGPFLIWGKIYKLHQLAVLFKTGGNVMDNSTDMQKLLEQIYTPEKFEAYYQWVKDQIRSRHTLEVWMNISRKEKEKESQFIIWGKSYSLQSLATIFKTWRNNPLGNDADMQKLLEQIYTPKEFETYVQSVINQIKSRHSLDTWMNLSAKEKRKEIPFIIWGKPYKLQSLAKFFKTEGDPLGVSADFKNLMIKIYWEEEMKQYSQSQQTRSTK